MYQIIKKQPVQLVISILTAFLLGHYLDSYVVSLFYTGSKCFIEILLFILPCIVFSFILTSIVSIKNGSIFLITLVFSGAIISNFISIFFAYEFTKILLPLYGSTNSSIYILKLNSSINQLYSFNLLNPISTDKSMFAGIILGVILSFLPTNNLFKKRITHYFTFLNEIIAKFLKKVFIPILPLYVFGLCLKLSYDQVFAYLFTQYAKIFFLTFGLTTVYMYMLYLIGSSSLIEILKNIKIMIPAALTAFTTMSSIATMPITLGCIKKLTKDDNFSNFIVPSTVNIHQLGNNFAIVTISLSLLVINGKNIPSIYDFALFAITFCLTKFSSVGIPGGAMLVALPVAQQFLNLTPEMISILATMYILQNPFITASNVISNGAFALIIKRYIKVFPFLSHD